MKFYSGQRLFYKFENESDVWTILLGRSMRGKYIYIYMNSLSEKYSISRKSLLDAINRGVIRAA